MPDGRVGLTFHNTVDGEADADVVDLAGRTAASIKDAYGLTGTAPKACSPSGAFTNCNCQVAGASYTEIWTAFETF